MVLVARFQSATKRAAPKTHSIQCSAASILGSNLPCPIVHSVEMQMLLAAIACPFRSVRLKSGEQLRNFDSLLLFGCVEPFLCFVSKRNQRKPTILVGPPKKTDQFWGLQEGEPPECSTKATGKPTCPWVRRYWLQPKLVSFKQCTLAISAGGFRKADANPF